MFRWLAHHFPWLSSSKAAFSLAVPYLCRSWPLFLALNWCCPGRGRTTDRLLTAPEGVILDSRMLSIALKYWDRADRQRHTASTKDAPSGAGEDRGLMLTITLILMPMQTKNGTIRVAWGLQMVAATLWNAAVPQHALC